MFKLVLFTRTMVYSLEVNLHKDKHRLLKIKGEITLKYSRILRDYFHHLKIIGNNINI